MDRNELAAAWESLKALPFPSSPQDHDLGDWLMDLLEVDGFYAGIAQSLVGGGRSPVMPRPDELVELAESLEHQRVALPEDEDILRQCHSYFAALERLHAVLLS